MPVRFTFANPLMKTWLLIHQTRNLMRRSENVVLAKLGLSDRRHSVLLAIKNMPSPVTVTDVAHWLDRNSNGISMLVDRMEKEGLVSRVRDMPDHREVRLVITRKGEESFKEANRLTWQLFQSLFTEINEEDLRKMSSLLEIVRGRALNFLKLDHSKEKIQILLEKKDISATKNRDEE